jgi:thiamine-phosphate pyrophosphorylase
VCALSKFPAECKLPILCYVTDRHSLAIDSAIDSRAALGRKMEALISAGIHWIQIREKDLTAREISALTNDALRFSRAHTKVDHQATRLFVTTRIMVNDRLDIALATSADGVHLGEKSLSAKDAKLLTHQHSSGPALYVGVSCHSIPAVQAAAADGADYALFGPVFATPSKAAFGSPQGIDRLAEACRSVPIPVIAIGGINMGNAAACLAARASGIAGIRLFQDATDPTATIEALRQLA